MSVWRTILEAEIVKTFSLMKEKGMLTVSEDIFSESLGRYYSTRGRMTDKQFECAKRMLVKAILDKELPFERFPDGELPAEDYPAPDTWS